MQNDRLAEFSKDLKRLSKKYNSIANDLETVLKVLVVFPHARPPFSFRLNNLGIESCVIKVKKMACQSLKGKGVNSGLRLVYAHFENLESSGRSTIPIDDAIAKKERIVLVEIYHKNEKANEDRDRILRNFD